MGSLTTVTAPGAVRQWQYNTHNQLASETHPESGTTTYTYVGHRLTGKTDANMSSFSYAYDGNDRLWQVTVGNQNTTVTYEPGSDRRQTVTVAGSGATRFEYDTAGRLDERQDIIGAYVFASSYGYDNNDNLVSLTYPSQRTLQYTFDSANRITQISEPQAGRDYALAVTHHPSGGLAGYTAGNLTTTSIGYDPQRYWVRSVASGPLQVGYDNYDGVGNVRLMTDARSGMNQILTYDLLNRLATANGPNGLPQVWSYDIHGNRQTVPGQTTTYQYDPLTLRLSSQSGVPFTYDNNGNLTTAGGASTYTYSPENWLVSATVPAGTATYEYDSDGWRTRKTTTDETTFYTRGPANEVLTEWRVSASATGTRDYVYAGSRLIAAVDRPASLPTACGGEARPDGTPQPLTISTAGGSASVTFEGSGCRRASVLVNVTSGSLGCVWNVEVRRVDNNAQVAGGAYSCNAGAFIEPFTLPVGGHYRVIVQAGGGASGSAAVRIYDIVDLETSIAPDGGATPIDLLVPGQNALLSFTGTANQSVSVRALLTSGSFGGGWPLEIRREADNAVVAGPVSAGASGFLDASALTANETYVVVVNPSGASTGSVTVHLYDASPVTTPISTDGTAVPVDLTAPGRNARLPFTGTQGQRVSLWVTVTTGSFGCAWPAEIRRADTNALVGSVLGCVGDYALLESVTLPVDGPYVVVVNPANAWTGTGLVRLYTVVDDIQAITPDGPPVSVSLLTPTQTARLQFTAAPGQRVSVLGTVTSTPGLGCEWKLRILRPDQTVLSDLGTCSNAFQEPLVLSTGGVYTIVVDPRLWSTGTASVALYDVPANVTGTVTINDTPVGVTLSRPGQNAYLTFAGTQGQQVTVRLTGNTIGTTWVQLRRPDNSVQDYRLSGSSAFNLWPQTLQSTGTYTVEIDPPNPNTGGISVQVTNP